MEYSKENNLEKLTNVFICPECGPYVQIMVEVWAVGAGSPFALEFINQSIGEIKTAFTLKMYEPVSIKESTSPACTPSDTKDAYSLPISLIIFFKKSFELI